MANSRLRAISGIDIDKERKETGTSRLSMLSEQEREKKEEAERINEEKKAAEESWWQKGNNDKAVTLTDVEFQETSEKTDELEELTLKINSLLKEPVERLETSEIFEEQERNRIRENIDRCKETSHESAEIIDLCEKAFKLIEANKIRIYSYVATADTVASKIRDIINAYNGAQNTTFQRSSLSNYSLLGGFITDSVLKATGGFEHATNITLFRSELYNIIDNMDDSNPIKGITLEPEYSLLDTVDRNYNGDLWTDYKRQNPFSLNMGVVSNSKQLETLIDKCLDKKKDCFLLINNELKKENGIYKILDQIINNNI